MLTFRRESKWPTKIDNLKRMRGNDKGREGIVSAHGSETVKQKGKATVHFRDRGIWLT